MRRAGRGQTVRMSSSSSRDSSGPLLAPYFAAKAAVHELANTMATEVACWGIETTIIIVPGIPTSGTIHFATAAKPACPTIAAEYMQGPLKGVDTVMLESIEKTFPKDASMQLVADAVAAPLDALCGSKPFRVSVDPFQDGSDEVMTLADEKHAESLERCGIRDICAFYEK